MGNPITNKVKKGEIPVIKKELDNGVVAEANNDGTIFLDKDIKNNSPKAKEAVAHEMVHMNQMARGDLNYDDNNVYWKGKEYPRDKMNEGSDQLPWEAEAYNKTKNMKKSSPNKIKLGLSRDVLGQRAGMMEDELRMKADKHATIGRAVAEFEERVDPFGKFADKIKAKNEEKEESAGKMNLKNKSKSPMKMASTPITMKAKGYSSPLKNTRVSQEVIKDANVDGKSGTITKNKTEKDTKEKKASVNEFAENCGTKDNPKAKSYVNSEGKPIACDWADDEDFDPESEYEVKTHVSYDDTFEPDKDKETTPGEPDKYNMGYYESMDAKWGAGVRHRGNKKVNRIGTRAGNKWDRKGGKIMNPVTGENYASKAEYVKSMASAATGTYDIPVGKMEKGKAGTETEVDAEAKDENKNFKKIDGRFVEVDAEGKPIEKKKEEKKAEENTDDSAADYNKKNKSKSAFKQKGWTAYKN